MSDGWDDDSVYGFVHTVEIPDGLGPLRSLRYETRNSGLFYLAATVEGLRLTEILKGRMEREAVRAPDPTPERRTPAFRPSSIPIVTLPRSPACASHCPPRCGTSLRGIRKRSEPHTATGTSLQQSLCAL